MDDWNLLQQYVCHASRAALDELVRRHVGMVYATALREVHDPHLAQDITQATFLVLMRRARSVSRNVALAGWLFHVVRFTAADARKARARREHHERQAAEMRSKTMNANNDVDAQRLVPLLNDAIASLGTRDRDAVVMCYLQGRSHREVAEAQRATENAVRQRLFRAMGKLRIAMRRLGVEASPLAITAALSHAAAQSTPPGLAAAVAGTLSAGAATGHGALVAQATIRSMVMLKMKIIASACAAMLVLSAGAGFVAHALADDTTPAAGPQATPAAPATEPATQPTTAPGPAATPKDTVKNLIADIESGDADAMVSCFDQPTDDEVKVLKSVVRVLSTATDLRKAVVKQFGQDAGEQVIAMFGGTALQTNHIDGMKVTITGDKATMGEGPGGLQLVKIGDVWKMTSNGPAIAQAGTFFDNIDQQLPAVKTMTADVKAGKYASLDDLKQAIKDIVIPKSDNGL